MAGVFDFPVGGAWTAVVGVLAGSAVKGFLDVLAVFGLVLALGLLCYLMRDVARLGRLMFLRKLVKFCERNGVKEIVCVMLPAYIAFLDLKGEVVKRVYPQDDFGWSFNEFLENVRLLGRELGVEVRWFRDFLDLGECDRELFQKLNEYEERVSKEERQGGE
jgi:hypothetical protein